MPFENNCGKGISEKEQITCSEKTLRSLISEQLSTKTEFKGSVYVYLTVTEKSEIIDIKIKSYPQNDKIDIIIKEATEKINVKAGKYKRKTVKSRLWTSFKFK